MESPYPKLVEANKFMTKQFVTAHPHFDDLLSLNVLLDAAAKAFAEVVGVDDKAHADLAQAVEIFSRMGNERSKLEVKQLVTQVDDDASTTVAYRDVVNMALIDQGLVKRPLTRDMPLVPPEHSPRRNSLVGRGVRRKKRPGRVRKPRRGHLDLSCSVELGSDGYELSVQVRRAKHLLNASSAYVALTLDPDPTKKTKRKTAQHPGPNPEWRESFTWTIPDGELNPELRLRVNVFSKKTLSKQFVGGMTFVIQDILDLEEPSAGYFILLDQSQADKFNFPSPQAELEGSKTRALSRQASQGYPTPTLKAYSEEDVEYLMLLGKGNFGKVFLGKDKTCGELVAIKVLQKHALCAADDVQSALTERRVLLVAHEAPNMARLLGTFETRTTLHFIMEPLMGGALVSHLMKSKNGVFPEATMVFYAAQLCQALFFLHSRGIIYRDLKLDNVLLDAKGNARLTDFGLSKDGLEPTDMAHTFCGTPNYLAPEIVEYRPYNKAVDFWSLGVVIFEALVGHPLFKGEDEMEIFDAVVNQEIEIPSSLSKNARAILSEFLQRDPSNRLVGLAIRDHAFFKSIDWEKLAKGKIRAPIQPKLKAPDDFSNFEAGVAGAEARISPTPDELLDAIDQDAFRDFSDTFSSSFEPITE